MKKLISILLVCTMIILGSVTVFSVEEEVESYDLSELFTSYDEQSLSDMVKFVGSYPQAYRFIEFFCKCSDATFSPIFFIHRSGDDISRFPNVLEVGFTELSPQFLSSTSRVTSSGNASYDVLIGDVGDKVMSVELEEGFIQYVNSLDRINRNKIILNFLMNMEQNEEIVGISWAYNYWIGAGIPNYFEFLEGDCNGDGAVNAIDSNLIRKAIVGNDEGIDPLTVDINTDGDINAKDSLTLKLKLVKG